MMCAFAVDASRMSDSEMGPMPWYRILTLMFSVESGMRVSARASADPSTSALMIILSGCLSWLVMSSRVLMTFCFARSVWRCCMFWCCEAISLACFSDGMTLKASPACGGPLSPRI